MTSSRTLVLAIATAACAARPQRQPAPVDRPAQPAQQVSAEGSAIDEFDRQMLFKALTDQSFYVQLSPEMIVRKVRYSGADKFVVPAYLFSPRDTTGKRATMVSAVSSRSSSARDTS